MLFAVCFWGCQQFRVEETETRPYIHNADEFVPLSGDQQDAEFWSDGSQNEYKLKAWTTGSITTFQALSHDEIVDQEVYEVRDGNVFLLDAVGEKFEEPLPLLKFPLRVGEGYAWKGHLACSEAKHTGEATISTSSDFVRLKDKSEEAVKVEISLKIDQGSPRKLSFWFVKGKGVLKTEMGKNVREPKV